MKTIEGIKIYQFEELSKTAQNKAVQNQVNFLKSIDKSYVTDKKAIINVIKNFTTWFLESGETSRAFNIKIENANQTAVNYILMDKNLYYNERRI